MSLKWDAELYHEQSSMQRKIGLMAIERLKPKNQERILDIGCGDASLSMEIAKKIPDGEVVGVEVSENMVKYARKKLKKAGINNVSILHMNALNIDFKEEFDAVFSNIAVHWIKRRRILFSKMFESLKNNGRLVITIMDYSYKGGEMFTEETRRVDLTEDPSWKRDDPDRRLRHGGTIFELFFGIITKEEYIKYFLEAGKLANIDHWSTSRTIKSLKRVGFSNFTFEPFIISKTFKDAEEYIRYMQSAGWVTYLSPYPEGVKKEILEELLMKISERDDLVFDERWKVVFLDAIKKVS
ncbi:MAG: class I SAM-dependent methyltransferase [Candidatus Hodarchaeota archaeon]